MSSKKAKHESTTTNPNWLELPRDLTSNPNWLELPRDVTSNILLRLCPIQILKNARNVCPDWWNICKDPLTWRQIHMLDVQPYLKINDIEFLIKLCKHAVDLSSGHLEEICINEFGTDHLLQHIADRASNLRCIRLNSCTRMSDEGWCEIANKCPMLEEIHISNSRLSKKSLEAIGQNCSLLKSLTFNGKCYLKRSAWDADAWDADASIIAKTMPKLSYLDIHENSLTDVGLLSILNACPLLESLNIIGCWNLEFGVSWWEMLHNQIKDLKIGEHSPDTYSSDDELEPKYWENVDMSDNEWEVGYWKNVEMSKQSLKSRVGSLEENEELGGGKI